MSGELAFQFDDPLLGRCILRRRSRMIAVVSSAELAAPNQITRQTDARDDDERQSQPMPRCATVDARPLSSSGKSMPRLIALRSFDAFLY